MIKKLFLTLLILIGSTAILVFIALLIPYYYYNNVITRNVGNGLFSIHNYSKEKVRGGEEKDLNTAKLPNNDLWEKFHLSDLKIPLPLRNPFYFVAPILEYSKVGHNKDHKTHFGLSIYNVKKQIISKVFFLSNKPFPNYFSNQKLFELPLVQKKINKIKKDKIWRDVFVKDLSSWKVSYEDMLYNLYLLEFRSQLLSMPFKKISFYKDIGAGVIELDSKNKDFKTELIMTKRNETIFSFLLVSSRTYIEADLVRFKMIKEIEPEATTESLSKILLREFKFLRYEEQIDHKGMLYLLSAWSHDQSKTEFLEKIIFHLERGKYNELQLRSLYAYLSERFGKTYANKRIENLGLKNELLLKRNIELEKRDEREVEDHNSRYEDLSSDKESVDEMLRRAKKNKKRSKNTLRVN